VSLTERDALNDTEGLEEELTESEAASVAGCKAEGDGD
jgi:hypothetical protein